MNGFNMVRTIGMIINKKQILSDLARELGREPSSRELGYFLEQVRAAIKAECNRQYKPYTDKYAAYGLRHGNNSLIKPVDQSCKTPVKQGRPEASGNASEPCTMRHVKAGK